MRHAHHLYRTEEWPRTRLDLNRAFDGDAVAEPTRPVPVVPMPQRRAQPPIVTPIPRRADGARRTPTGADAETPGPVPGEDRLQAADFIERVFDEQRELNAAGSRRMDAMADSLGGRVRRIGPGGFFGWKPASGPTLAEVAAARVRIAEREERRKYAHQAHMDRLEAARAYVKLAILLGLFVLVVVAGWEGFMIITGQYSWAPTRVK